VLPATTDPTTSPQGVTYRVTEFIEGASQNVYEIEVPHTAVGGTVDLGELAVVVDQALTYYRGPSYNVVYRLLMKLRQGLSDASIVVVGDSTGDATDEWVYRLAVRIGELYPTYTVVYTNWANTAATSYSGVTTLQEGTGDVTLTIWNMSVGGKDTYFALAPHFQAKIVEPQGDLYIINHGHNEGAISATNTAEMFFARYVALTESIRDAVPSAALLCIAQNPRPVNTYQAARALQIQLACELLGYGFVSVLQAFYDYGDDWGTALVDADTVHPNAAGQELWFETIWPLFQWVPGVQGVQGTQTRTGGQSSFQDGIVRNLIPDITPADWDPQSGPPPGWTATNVTLSKDTTNAIGERDYGLRMEANGPGNALIFCDVENYAAYIGKPLLLHGEVLNHRGSANTLDGVFGLGDGVATAVSRGDEFGWGNFSHRALPFVESVGAERLRVSIYAAFGGSATGDAAITLGSLSMHTGIIPRTAVNL
jgi:hypothetical protein